MHSNTSELRPRTPAPTPTTAEVDTHGDAPADPIDYRFSLANERTFLAWIRTALGLLAGGVAVQALAEQFSTPEFRRALAASCTALAVVLATVARSRWLRVEATMRCGDQLPDSVLVPMLAFGVSVIALAAGVAVVVS